MDAKTANLVFNAASAAILVGVVAYSVHQQKKLDATINAGLKEMKNTKHKLVIPRPNHWK